MQLKGDSVMDKSKIYDYTNDIKEMGEKLKVAKADDIGYIFIADLHNGAYLLEDAEKHLTFYESDEAVALKEAKLLYIFLYACHYQVRPDRT